MSYEKFEDWWNKNAGEYWVSSEIGAEELAKAAFEAGRESNAETPPIAWTRINESGTQYIIDKCPHCREEYYRSAGHRVGHCDGNSNRGYFLMERKNG